ncbi:hypothetical protein [Methylomonas methanica]|uniref:Uncharacterized protein n=1 Tax=Methylomonas methanica (strain DSM 25384 / MC09) TaxID=857087 RepID=F9ZXD8_METMM|nr:hypothetical protein [Methylomonas methanica]AEG00926.1 hypothetical protein Metme_2535 [Methylomonas methanica MC09]
MKSQQLTLFTGAMLLVWSLRSDAHSGLDAMQNGGSLLKLTAGLLHPLLESGYLPALGILTISILAIAALRHRLGKVRRLSLNKTRRV